MPFIGKQSTSNSQITNYTTTVGSGGQTNFTVVIEGGDETHVYLNGVLLKETTDYTVSSTQVSLVSPTVENDIVEIKVFRSFALADAVRASDGGTFSGDVTVPNLIVGDGGNIGSASDTNAISIASSGNVTLSQTLDGGAIGSAVTMSANQACVKTALNASGSAPIYACRAWVNFNGTGTVAIRDSGNVSSITDNSTGNYTINFTTAMADSNYVVTNMTSNDATSAARGHGGASLQDATPLTTSSVRIEVAYGASGSPGTNGAVFDASQVQVAIFR